MKLITGEKYLCTTTNIVYIFNHSGTIMGKPIFFFKYEENGIDCNMNLDGVKKLVCVVD